MPSRLATTPPELAQERLLYLVVSTHGDGDRRTTPSVLRFLLGRKAPRLEQLRFTVLALGDSSYPKFCEAGRIADEAAALRASPIAPRIDCDVDFDAAAAAPSDSARHAAEALKPAGDALPTVDRVATARGRARARHTRRAGRR